MKGIQKIRFCHVIHYDYLNAASPSFPRVDYLVEALRKENLPVKVYARETKFTSNNIGQYGESILRIPDYMATALCAYRKIKQHIDIAKPRQPPVDLNVVKKNWRRSTEGFVWALGFFPDYEVYWARSIKRALSRRLGSGDLVVTCSRPESVGLIGQYARSKGARWWFDLADGWCWEGIRQQAHGVTTSRIEEERKLEKQYISTANGISTVNNYLADYFSSVSGNKPVHIYPNVIPREFSDVFHNFTPAKETTDDCYTILYFGRLRGSDANRNLATLKRVINTKDIADPVPRFLFYGEYSPADVAEIESLRQYGCQVTIQPAIERKYLIDLLVSERVQAMLVINSKDSKAGTSKLLDALGIGLPVLLISRPDSEAARLIDKMGIGFLVAHQGPLNSWRKSVEGLRAIELDKCKKPKDLDGVWQSKILVEKLLSLR